MEILLTPSRSAVAWRGLSNTLLGIILLSWPQATVYVVILFFALNLIIVGFYSIIEPLINKRNPHAIMSVALGILGVTFGLYLIIKRFGKCHTGSDRLLVARSYCCLLYTSRCV